MTQKENWGKASFTINRCGGDTLNIILTGRDRWALECLIAAGENGCTPIDTPGPRWSGYVFNLRSAGVDIETVTEAHDGPFSGHHARYVLRCNVQCQSEGDAA